jgi:hypothetical protein
MAVNEDELRDRIVKMLENSFVSRRTADPAAIAAELAKTVDLPVEVIAEKVTTVAKGLGVGVMQR